MLVIFPQFSSRLGPVFSDLLPALSVCGTAPPADGLLTMVRCALEDSVSLLQSQHDLVYLPGVSVPETSTCFAGGRGQTDRRGHGITEGQLDPGTTAASSATRCLPFAPGTSFFSPYFGKNGWWGTGEWVRRNRPTILHHRLHILLVIVWDTSNCRLDTCFIKRLWSMHG